MPRLVKFLWAKTPVIGVTSCVVLPDQIKIKKLQFWSILRGAGVHHLWKVWCFTNTYLSSSILSLKLAKCKWFQVPEIAGGYSPVGLCCCSSSLLLFCRVRKGCEERSSGSCFWCLFHSCSQLFPFCPYTLQTAYFKVHRCFCCSSPW